MPNYYSTQPFLAWVLNEYFYDSVHYAFVAPFYPYRLPNPSSSSPYDNYSKLYRPWKDRDNHDEYVSQKRQNLRKGVMALRKQEVIADGTAEALLEICDKVSLKYFCPVVYRVDLANIAEERLSRAGSGQRDSVEHLIEDLRSDEFEVLFFDYWDDERLRSIFTREEDATAILRMLKDDYVNTA